MCVGGSAQECPVWEEREAGGKGLVGGDQLSGAGELGAWMGGPEAGGANSRIDIAETDMGWRLGTQEMSPAGEL